MTDIWTGEKALERQIAGTPAGAGMDAAEMLREVHDGREWLEEKWGALSRFSGKG